MVKEGFGDCPVPPGAAYPSPHLPSLSPRRWLLPSSLFTWGTKALDLELYASGNWKGVELCFGEMIPTVWVEDGPMGWGRRQGLILPRREALSPKPRHGKCGEKAKQIEVLASSRSCPSTVIQSMPGHRSLWLPGELAAWPYPVVGASEEFGELPSSRCFSPPMGTGTTSPNVQVCLRWRRAPLPQIQSFSFPLGLL